jgi:hypothetical protein
MDPSAFLESLQRGLGEVPPVAIALVLLAGPTVALIGYRLFGVARRLQVKPEGTVMPFWVCQDCRSVNELRLSRCYRCGIERDDVGEVEIVVNQPAIRAVPVDLPAGSPFAAIATGGRTGPGVPVMAERNAFDQPVPVGPGREPEAAAAGSDPDAMERVEAKR